jgi:uncharacterized OB-fold protein
MQNQTRQFIDDKPIEGPDLYLQKCTSCGGQFPTFRAICSECEDIADVEGFRDGKKAVSSPLRELGTSGV